MVLAAFAALRIGFFGRYGRCLQEIQLERSNSVGFTSMKDLLCRLYRPYGLKKHPRQTQDSILGIRISTFYTAKPCFTQRSRMPRVPQPLWMRLVDAVVLGAAMILLERFLKSETLESFHIQSVQNLPGHRLVAKCLD